ncbi:MAG: TolC family protein [Gemmatimonadales bacterium]
MPVWLVVLAVAVCAARPAQAQDTTVTQAPASDTALALRPQATTALTLGDALTQARRSSPAYQQVLNNADPARWGVRNAYGEMLPSLQVSGGLGYTGAGQSQFGAFFDRTSPFVGSSYDVGLSWEFSGASLANPRRARSLERATAQDIEGAGVSLRADVTDQYLASKAAYAQTEVAREQVRRNAEFLRLAEARYRVGQATLLDVRQAEATKATSDAALLRAYQQENEAKLELFRRIGLVPPAPIEQIALSDSFPVTAPAFQLDQLLGLAEEQNPSLRALRERESAARDSVKVVRSEFFPRLRAQAGWAGFTQQFTDDNQLLGQRLSNAQSAAAQCQYDNQIRDGLGLGGTTPDCFGTFGLNAGGGTLTDATAQSIRDQNDVYPFDFASQPFQARLTVSLPIFTGFSRSLRLAKARAAQKDADESVRAQALQVRTNVHARYLGLETSYRTIALQERSRTAAREQLRLAQDRYRVGIGTALEVTDAQNAVQRAEGDYVTAVFDYHRAIAALEAAVGRPLR